MVEALVRHRGDADIVVRASVYRAESAPDLEQLGADEVMVADMTGLADVEAAFAGVDAAYLIAPNMHPGELEVGHNAVAAASAQGCSTLVYHSVLHPQTEGMPHHWRKLRVEELLFTSEIPTTILQPAAYQQNLLASWPRIVEEGVLAVPYAADTRIALVDLLDVAEVAARVLTEPGHEHATYELCGPEAPTQDEVAEALGAVLGRAVRVEVVPRPIWREQALARGLGDEAVDTLLRMFEYYERFGFLGSPKVLEWLLGRPPADLATFARRVRDSHRG